MFPWCPCSPRCRRRPASFLSGPVFKAVGFSPPGPLRVRFSGGTGGIFVIASSMVPGLASGASLLNSRSRTAFRCQPHGTGPLKVGMTRDGSPDRRAGRSAISSMRAGGLIQLVAKVFALEPGTIRAAPLNGRRGVHPCLGNTEHDIAMARVVGEFGPTQAIEREEAHL